MRRLLRIFQNVALILVVLAAVAYWGAPIALSFYAARKALPVARVVPTDLKDLSISQAQGMKLSYLGYEFEVPWTDLDVSKTKLYPENKSEKTMAILTFRSGLTLRVLAGQPRSLANQFAKDMKMSPQAFEAVFGHDAALSDYAFWKRVYAFTPDSMHHWTLSPAILAREEVLLVVKSIAPSKPAETGIFNICNQGFEGFQQGDPRVRQDHLLVTLYSRNGSFEISFIQKKYLHTAGVTQPEINRIIQSVQKSPTTEVARAAKPE
jgi:hypothetical protein